MNLKDLELKINDRIKEQELNNKYDVLWKSVEEIKRIVRDILIEELKINNRTYISEYRNNVIIKNYDTNDEIIIKLKKKRSESKYILGFGSSYDYAIENVKIDNSEFETLDDYISKVEKVVEERKQKNNNFKNNFEDELSKHNISIKDFYNILGKYNCLNWETRLEYEKEMEII